MSSEDLDPTEPLDDDGWWWRPGDEANSVHGRITLGRADSFANLRLHGRFPSHEGESGTHEILWGQLENKGLVTCVRSLFMKATGVERHTKEGIFSHTGSESVIKWFLLGAHVHAKLLKVTTADIYWDRADEWFGTPRSSWSHTRRTRRSTVKRLNQLFLKCPIPKLKAQLELRCFTSIKAGRSATNLSHPLLWRLRFDKPTPIGDVHDAMMVLRDFMWLAVGVRIPALRVELELQKKKRVTLLGSVLYRKPSVAKNLHEFQMCLPYRLALDGCFAEVLNAWTNLRQRETKAFSTWSNLFPSEPGPVERDFTAPVLFLDSILPRGGKHIKQDEFKAVADDLATAIPTTLPNELRVAIKNKIWEANATGLRPRLESAFRSLPEVLVSQFELNDKLADDAVSGRGAMFHSGGRGMTIEKAMMLHPRIRIAALAHILQKLGIPDETIAKRIEACTAWHPPKSVGTL